MDEYKKLLVGQIPSLLRYATALTGNPVHAEDLLQDCLERALKKSAQWNPEKKLSTWLHTILHNLFVDQYRRQKNSPLTDNGGIDHSSVSQSNQLDFIQLQEVKQHIANLPEEQREVLLLVSLQGMDYKTVSEIVDAPMGTVMSRLHRARKALIAKHGNESNLTEEVLDI
jgi:RNA polymerase sigma-70 factor (ECF subfamily)